MNDCVGSEAVGPLWVEAVPSFADLPPLDRAVEHAIALYKPLDVIPGPERQITATMLGTVLKILGREVAASLQRARYSLWILGGAPIEAGRHANGIAASA